MTDRTTTTDYTREEREVEQHEEGRTARAIEYHTAKLPSDVFLWASVGSMMCSFFYKMRGQNHLALFCGQWVPTFLILGLYNKLVKVAGSDQMS
jgi:hypothetical protein